VTQDIYPLELERHSHLITSPLASRCHCRGRRCVERCDDMMTGVRLTATTLLLDLRTNLRSLCMTATPYSGCSNLRTWLQSVVVVQTDSFVVH